MSIDAQQLLLLLNWMSPAFPTGAFAYSHGLEWAIEEGAVVSADDVEGWIGDLISRGSGWNDAVLFCRCYEDDVEELNELALALAGSKERYLETTQLGRSFRIAAAVFLPSPLAGEGGRRPDEGPQPRVPSPAAARHLLPQGEREDFIAYPIATGTACAAMRIGKHHALLAYLQGFCSTLTSVAVRLVPLGQTAGLEVLRNLMPVITATAERASSATLDDLGAISIGADIAAMKHETQYSRVFRT